jgi:cobalt-zinc-cadmium efflux system protein
MNLAEESFKNQDPSTTQKNLQQAVVLTFCVFLLEAVGGWLAQSLALLSDAAHMFMDVFALTLTWMALKISCRPSTRTKTYGYHRIEILAALANGLLLMGISFGILYEAYERYQAPPQVRSAAVMAIALAGLFTNLAVMRLLKHDALHSHDLNLKSAFYHVLGDSLASLAVIASGGVMFFTGWYAADAIAAGVIGLLLIWGAWSFIADSLHILLEGVPKGISIQDVERELVSIPDIKGIHELHIWCLCSNIYALSTHALINDQRVNQVELLLNEIETRLREKFNITHSTVQFEANPCRQIQSLCAMKHH